jgi:parvulin-like peptidyl-prolyl isomerase
MAGANPFQPRRGWRRIVCVGGCAAVTAGALWAIRGSLPWARAQSANTTPTAQVSPEAGATPGDYSERVVAYVNGSERISRRDLGEYLVVRYGVSRLPNLINERILNEACQQRGFTVTEAEIDAGLQTNLQNLKLDLKSFTTTILARYRKNLIEWRQDVIRPRILLTKLSAEKVQATDEDIRKAYESVYGEKVEARMIFWPLDQEAAARASYNALSQKEEAFAEKAKKQHDTTLSSSGGKLQPFGRYALEPNLEQVAFRLRPGEVSELVKTPQGWVILKCDKKHPAQTAVSLASVREKLAAEIRDAKVQDQMRTVFEELRKQAKPEILLKETETTNAAVPPPNEVVATYSGNKTITREELGEYLIHRYGTEKLDLLINRIILEKACAARKITVSSEEIEAGFKQDLKNLNVTKAVFQKEFLSKYGKNLVEWREDVVRPKLLMTKLCKERVKVSDADIKKAFEAHFGEKLECRIILWPTDQAKYALTEYAKLRDSDKEFTNAAKRQASPSLAAEGGKIPTFGHYSLGDENLEREAFKLQPGEVSSLIGTPQGQVMLKVDKRIPPDTKKKLEQEKAALYQEVFDRMLQQEMQVVFKELREKASPRLLLKDPNRMEDLAADSRRLLADSPVGKAVPKK